MTTFPTSVFPDRFGRLAAYAPPPGLYDEYATGNGMIRPHWQKIGAMLDRLGPDELSARLESARRIVREDGITYNIYGDPQGMDSPWGLDVVPMLIPPAEWRRIERGLSQRATLLNLVLSDLYGPQELLRTGVLPPALVFANPAFLRSCHGVKVRGNVHLHLYAADLARSPGGDWWVVADRTQAPSGTGYALENRIVLARVLPEEYREAQVHRLAPFFATFRESLRQLAPRSDNPHVVLLTPGPHNETYFEHAYLARYLGLTLVEGGDLTVRDSSVFVKTLEGLQRVDVILRRVDDTFCDPLELRGDSFLGVAGLVQAVRAGNVTVANALGSSLVESPVFLAFLPWLCQRVLGEELLLPSVATWWCGQGKEQTYVLEHLEEMVIKPAFGMVSQLPFFGSRASGVTREKLTGEIKRRPAGFVGQEQVAFSTAPTWIDEAMEPRGVAVRFFATASGNSYHVMPGGLTRLSPAPGAPVESMQSGGGSKDTWVLAEEPVSPITLLTDSGTPASAIRISAEAPSRVADNLFWLGRYAERLEATLRLLRCALVRICDEGSTEAASELSGILQILTFTERLPAQFSGRIPAREVEKELLDLVCNSGRAGSAREIVLQLGRIARAVRDRLSADTWRILNQIQLDSKARAGRLTLANAQAICNRLIVDLAAFSGMEMENMTRGHGWRFLDLGRRLERASTLIATVQGALQVHPSPELAGVLLEYADSSMTHRRRYFSEPRLESALELLLADASNPRSLAFQLQVIREHASDLPSMQTGEAAESLRIRTKRLCEQAKGGALGALGREEDRANLLAEISSELDGLSEEITRHYFCHTLAHRVETGS